MANKYHPKWGKIFWAFIILVVVSLAVTFLNNHFG
jgi:hypothetical protein